MTGTIFDSAFGEKRDHRRHSTKVHRLLLTFVYWLKCLAEYLQRGSCLCRVRRRLGYGEVKTQLRIEVVLRAGAHNVRV